MNDHDEGVMIALLPITTDWCEIKLPHMTLVYCGKIGELAAGTFDELVKDTSALASLSRSPMLRVRAMDTFGEDSDKVDVLKLQITPEIAAMRRSVEKWNKSEHKDFKPHVTVGMAGQPHPEPPKYISFNRMCVQWGEDMVVFNLRG